MVGGGSSTLHVLCTLSLLPQLHLRSSDIRSWRLGTPVLYNPFQDWLEILSTVVEKVEAKYIPFPPPPSGESFHPVLCVLQRSMQFQAILGIF